jgi:hypothetical protein
MRNFLFQSPFPLGEGFGERSPILLAFHLKKKSPSPKARGFFFNHLDEGLVLTKLTRRRGNQEGCVGDKVAHREVSQAN